MSEFMEVKGDNTAEALAKIQSVTSDDLMRSADTATLEKAQHLVNSVNLSGLTPKEIREIGSDVTSAVSVETDRLLNQCSVTKAGDIGKEINDLAVVAKRITASTVVPTGLAGVLDRFSSYKGKHMKLVTQLDSIVNSVEKCGKELQDSLDFLDSIRRTTSDQFTGLEAVEIGLGMLIESQREMMETDTARMQTPFSAMEEQQKMAALQSRQKDVASQRVQCQIAVYESMIIMIINQQYTDLLTYQIANTIPAAKTQIIHSLGIKASKDAADLSKSLNATLNKMVEKNAEAVLSSVKELHDSSQRSTFNTSSLQSAAAKISEAKNLLAQANNISIKDHDKALAEIHSVLNALGSAGDDTVKQLQK